MHTLISLVIIVGIFSSSCSLTAVLPLNKSIDVPGGSNPWCCCHFKACPNNANKRDGGTTLTSSESDCAIACRLFSLV